LSAALGIAPGALAFVHGSMCSGQHGISFWPTGSYSPIYATV